MSAYIKNLETLKAVENGIPQAGQFKNGSKPERKEVE